MNPSNSVDQSDQEPRFAPPPVMGLAVLLIIALFISVAWVRARQGRHSQPVPSTIEQLAKQTAPPGGLTDAQFRGRAIYRRLCYVCHGPDGKGDGPNSPMLEPKPRDLTSEQFWAQTTDERVQYAITEGGRSVGKSPLMPPWGLTLSKSDIQDVIAYLRTLPEASSAKSGAASPAAGPAAP